MRCFDRVLRSCTDSIVAAVKVLGTNGHRTLAEVKPSVLMLS